MTWIGAFREAIDAQTAEPGSTQVGPVDDAKYDATIPEFADLTDAQLHVLLELVCNEGLRRGFCRWWWE